MGELNKKKIFQVTLLATLCVLISINSSMALIIGDTSSADKRAADVIIKEIEFKSARVQDAVRVISELTNVNIVATAEAGKSVVTVYVRNLSVTDVVDSICRIAGLWYRYNEGTGIFIVMTTEEYQKDIVVFRDQKTRQFLMKYLNVGIVAKTIEDLFGERVVLDTDANNYLGDDYELTISDDLLSDEDDDSDSNSSSNSNSNSSSSDYSDLTQLSNNLNSRIVLSSAQLSVLSELNDRNMKRISDELVGQVTDRAEAPIYLSVNRLHNMLYVRTADSKAMQEIAKLIKDSDLQVPEVLLEMKVIEVELNDSFESSFDLSFIDSGDETGPDDGQNLNPLNSSATSVGNALLGSGNFGVMDDSTFVFQLLNDNIRARLQLLDSEGNINSIATPMLLASNNQPARLFIGEEAILTTGYESQTVSITSGDNVTVSTLPIPVTETRDIGNTLTILPSINADRSVVLRVKHENSSLKTAGGTIPVLIGDSVENVVIDTVDTSTLEGTFVAQDGMTVAVGGMIREYTVSSEDKVPVLGDIPLLGFFFKSQEEQTLKTELILLITPHVMTQPRQGEAITRNRLEELSAANTNLDLYLDNLSRSRDKTSEGQKINADVQSDTQEKLVTNYEDSFIRLTQVAASQVRVSSLLREAIGNIEPVRIGHKGRVQLFKNSAVQTQPAAMWFDGQHYVTAIEVQNISSQALFLDVSELSDKWLAATLESAELGSKNSSTESTYLYLISKKSFTNTLGGFLR